MPGTNIRFGWDPVIGLGVIVVVAVIAAVPLLVLYWLVHVLVTYLPVVSR